MHRRPAAIVGATCAAIMLLAGCTAGSPTPSGREDDASPFPCAIVGSVDQPADCEPHDGESAMALNDRHRTRMPITDAQAAANQIVADDVRPALQPLQTRPDLSAETVRAALTDLGAEQIETRETPGTVRFATSPPTGGCVFGVIRAEELSVGVGGYILDGGCLPAD